ncbi:MAG: alkaline phosphatase family protein [Myxococcota bacterium]
MARDPLIRGVRWILSGVLALVVVLVLGWAPIFDWMAPGEIGRAGPEPASRTRSSSQRLVVLISIDGLAPRFLATTPTPHIDRLASQGAVATEARTVVPSITMASHTSMISGVSPNVHGVHFNRYQPWSRVGVPTIYTECEHARLRCGLFAGKRKFAHFAEDESGVERYRWGPDAHSVIEQALDYIRTASPDFVMIHLAEVDRAGHDDGWGSEQQRDRIRMVDALLGEFVDELTDWAERPLVLIVTSDHGGHDRQHGSDRSDDVDIPWIAWGDGIPAGGRLADVGTEDTAATVMSLLGLDVPGDWTGRPRL